MDTTSRNGSTRAARHIFAGILAATAAIAAAPADAAVDMFLKLDGIKGESQDKTHKDEVDVLSWSWGAAKGSAGQRASPNQVCSQQLSVTKYVDLATAGLTNNLVLGSTIPNATLTVRKAGDKPLEYLVIKLNGVLVSSLQTEGSGGDDRLTESINLAFSGGTITYTPQKPDGTGGTSVTSPLPATCP
jgi:type VI secretion system secreted protein Hcp